MDPTKPTYTCKEDLHPYECLTGSPSRVMHSGSDKSGKTLCFRMIMSLLSDCMGQDEKNVSKRAEWLILLEVSSFRTLSVRLCEGLMRPAAPVFSGGRTAPIGCPRHSGVSLACEWQNQWAGKELCQGSLNISPLNLTRNYIMAACLCWAMMGGRRRWGRGGSEGHTWDAMKVQHQEFDSKGQQAFFYCPI